MRYTPALGAFLLATSAHGSAPFVESDTAKWFPGFQCRGGKYGLRLPSSYVGLTKLAQLQQERLEMIEQDAGYTVTRKDLHFPGLVIGVAVPSSSPNRYLVSGAAISQMRWKSLAPFRPGQTVQQVQKLLGKSAADDSGLKASYGSETSDVSFKVSEGRVVEVIYQCYTG